MIYKFFSIIDKENFEKRHLALTLYLYLSLFVGVYFLKNDIGYVFKSLNFDNSFLSSIGILDTIFTIMLLNWKKWAFYGLLVTSLAIMIYNLVNGVEIIYALIGFSGFILIYLLLLIRKNGKSGWENLS